MAPPGLSRPGYSAVASNLALRHCKNARRYTAPPTASQCTPVHKKSGVKSDDEDLPGLDVGGARGAVLEVDAASDHEDKNTRTGLRTRTSSLYVVQTFLHISHFVLFSFQLIKHEFRLSCTQSILLFLHPVKTCFDRLGCHNREKPDWRILGLNCVYFYSLKLGINKVKYKYVQKAATYKLLRPYSVVSCRHRRGW